MSSEVTELQAIENLAKADRRYRLVAMTLIGFSLVALSFFTAHQLIELRKDIRNILSNARTQNALRQEEIRRYDTCLLLIPIAERTEEAQTNCFNYADLPGGLDVKNFKPISPEAPSGASNESVFVPNQVSSSPAQHTHLQADKQTKILQRSYDG